MESDKGYKINEDMEESVKTDKGITTKFMKTETSKRREINSTRDRMIEMAETIDTSPSEKLVVFLTFIRTRVDSLKEGGEKQEHIEKVHVIKHMLTCIILYLISY